MFLIKTSLLILIAICQPLPLNSISYTMMYHKNLSSSFSEIHLLRVYESFFDMFQCLAQCNIIDNCQTVKFEPYNKITKCSIFKLTPRNIDILEVSNDIILYIKSGMTDWTFKKNLIGHNRGVWSLVVLTNGVLASGSVDKTIKIWDTNSGIVKNNLDQHNDSVSSVIELPNGDLVSGSMDTTIKIWDANSRNVKYDLIGHTSVVYCLIVLPNGDLASGSADKIIKIWDKNSWTIKYNLMGHTGGVYSLVILPNGDLVSGSSDGIIKIWIMNYI